MIIGIALVLDLLAGLYQLLMSGQMLIIQMLMVYRSSNGSHK